MIFTNRDLEHEITPIQAVLLARRLLDRTNDKWASQICGRILWSAASKEFKHERDHGYVLANLMIVKAALRSALAMRQPRIKEAIDHVSELAKAGNPQAMTLTAQVLDYKEEFLKAREQFEATHKVLQSIPKDKSQTTWDRRPIRVQSAITNEAEENSNTGQEGVSSYSTISQSNPLRNWRMRKARTKLEQDRWLDVVTPADFKLKYGQFLLKMGGGESMSEEESHKCATELITSAALEDGHLEACLELARLEEENENRGWNYHDCLTKLALSGNMEAAKILGDLYSLEEHEWRKFDPTLRAYVESPTKTLVDGSVPPFKLYGDIKTRNGAIFWTRASLGIRNGIVSGRTRYFKALDWYRYASSGGYIPAMCAGLFLADKQKAGLFLDVFLFFQLAWKNGSYRQWDESPEGRQFRQWKLIPHSIGIGIWDMLAKSAKLDPTSQLPIVEKYQADPYIRHWVHQTESKQTERK
jgi:hypothetical protein